MSAPSIGGRVLDGSFIAALTRGSIAATAWIDTARLLGSTLLLPSLALTADPGRLTRVDPGIAYDLN